MQAALFDLRNALHHDVDEFFEEGGRGRLVLGIGGFAAQGFVHVDESLRGEAPDAEDQTPTPTFLEKLIDIMVQRIPKIEQSGLHSIHVGRDGITPDQRAIYSAAGPDGFYLACGLSGTGFKTSPAAGASLVELILDGLPKTVDITPFRFSRFAEGKLLEGEYGYGNIWK